jgi:hypothetical protein
MSGLTTALLAVSSLPAGIRIQPVAPRSSPLASLTARPNVYRQMFTYRLYCAQFPVALWQLGVKRRYKS